jgi:glucose-1-phosphate cytidylyltransferase
MTYGDGVADLDIAASIAFHKAHGRLATVTAVMPPARYGALSLSGQRVVDFEEKPPGDNGFINGGFFVLHPNVLDRIDGDTVPWERAPMESLARDGELMAFRHTGFWYAMDSLRDRTHLETLWQSGRAPWKVWNK